MNSTEREPFLQALDAVLLPLEFKRTKRSFEWKRKVDAANTEWIHLNFGLGIINPSFGVLYRDLEEMIPAELGVVAGVMHMLQPISGVSYSSETAPAYLAEHVLTFCVPQLPNLRNRPFVIRSLEGPAPRAWPVCSASDRMRLLPLMLAHEGRATEALEWLSRLEQAAPTMDQGIPEYAAFAMYMRGKYVG